MKQSKIRFLLLVLFLAVKTVVLAIEVDGIHYYIDEYNLTASVTYPLSNNDKYVGTIVIPSEFNYKGKKYIVNSIGMGAFTGCSGLTSITIPNSITIIETRAFSGCSSLTSITIPNSITEIESRAFSGCSSLTSVTIPNSVKSIGSSAFSGCSSLVDVSIGSTIIWDNAFSSCSGLTSVTIGNSVTSIGRYAFAYCSGLTSITIPNSVKSIGQGAFYGCSGLISVFSDSKDFSTYSFLNCPNLNNITLGEHVETFDLTIDIHKLRCMAKTPPIFREEHNNHTNGNLYQSYIELLEVPHGHSIKYAIDEEWRKIPIIYSVNNNTKYYPIPINYIGENVVSINGKIEGCEATEGEVVEIKANSSLTNNPLIMLNTQNVSHFLTEKGHYKFTVSEHHSENTINSFDFPLTSVTLSESGTLIDKINLDDILNIENLKITGNINGTDLLVIRKMENLKLLDLKDAHIVDGGMSYYKNYVTSKNKIGNDFFSDKEKLYTVILPQDITEICEDAFFKCYELRTISIPKTVKTMNASMFSCCDKFNSVHIEDLAAYCSIKFSQYVWRNHERDMYLNDKKIVDMVIPNGVTTINAYAFEKLNGLNSLVIPSSVTKIGNYAFDCPIQEYITCYNPTPPEIDYLTFGDNSGIPFNAPANYQHNQERVILYVPKGSKNLYWLHPYWEWFNNIVELGDTGIDDVTVNQHQQREGVYTIDGVKLSSNAGNTENLPKGIYIINGQKVVIK